MGRQGARTARPRHTSNPVGHSEGARLAAGRHAVSPLAMRTPAMRTPAVQAKLEVNEPGDPFEQQADTVADQVMRSPEPASPTEEPVSAAPDIQRKAEEDETCVECAQNPRKIQRQELADDETLPRAEVTPREEPGEGETTRVQRDGVGTPSVSARTASAIRSPGPGSPMSTSLRQRIEPQVGADLSNVRVHSDPQSAQAAGSLRARAFTFNNHIFLNRAESFGDLRLMAHEATHVVQQGGVARRQPLENAETPERAPTQSEGVGPARTSGVASAPTPVVAPATSSPATSSPATSSPATSSATSPGATASGTQPPGAATEASGDVSVARERGSEGSRDGARDGGRDGRGERGREGATAPVVPGTVPVGGVEGGVTVLMPDPPDALSPGAERRMANVQSNAGATAQAQRTLPDAATSVTGARVAVTEPEVETQARAQETLVAMLDNRPQPSPEIEELCVRIREVIRDKRPLDEDSLVKAKPEEMARDAGGELNRNVEDEARHVQDEYGPMQSQPTGSPETQPQPLAGTPPASQTGALGATRAAPDPVPAENVSLDADVDANRTRIQDAGMMSETAQAVQDGPIAEARMAQGELEETAARDPQQVLAEQDAAIATARTDMAALQGQALAALQQSRGGATAQRETQQVGMVGSEEQMRADVGRRASAIFARAQTQVDEQLRDLPRVAMQRWETGVARHAETFKSSLRAVEQWIEKRHESTVLAVWDAVTGLPGWVTRAYNRAEREFGDNVCRLMREISTEVNGVIAACQAIIQQARQDIETLYTSLPAELQGWAQQEQTRFSERLDALGNKVTATRDNFNRELRERAAQAVQDVRQQIHELRQAARGLIGRVADAVSEFLDDPVRAIINGLLRLVGIPPSAFWALVERIRQVLSDIADDPRKFANNLMKALKQGFERFFDNIGRHLLNGLLAWLFSRMGSVGVTMPGDFSLKSVITFFLQVMGITWARIRRLLAKHIGEQNVALIEQAWQLVSTLIAQGPQGIVEMIKDQLNPQTIIDMILQTAIDFVKEALIKQVALRIIGMLNPVGAIAQAIELIYKLLKWLFENAARIFTLIETIVKGAADLIAGNIDGMASAVEGALSRILPIVIDFLAGLLGLGDLPDKVAQTVKRLQAWVEKMLDKAIGFIVKKAKGLLNALGFGPKEQAKPEDESKDEFIYEEKVGAHTIKVRRDLTVFEFSKPKPIKGSKAQRALQKALNNLVNPKEIRYGVDGLGRASGPSGYIKGVKDKAQDRTVNPRKMAGGAAAFLPGDQGGHLIADRFYGPVSPGNLVPMNGNLNTSGYKVFENNVAKEYKKLISADKPVLVEMTSTPTYPANDKKNLASFRPTSLNASARFVTLMSGGGTEDVTTISDSWSNPDPGAASVKVNVADRAALSSVLRPASKDTGALIEWILRARPFSDVDDIRLNLALQGTDRHKAEAERLLLARANKLNFDK